MGTHTQGRKAEHTKSLSRDPLFHPQHAQGLSGFWGPRGSGSRSTPHFPHSSRQTEPRRTEIPRLRQEEGVSRNLLSSITLAVNTPKYSNLVDVSVN